MRQVWHTTDRWDCVMPVNLCANESSQCWSTQYVRDIWRRGESFKVLSFFFTFFICSFWFLKKSLSAVISEIWEGEEMRPCSQTRRWRHGKRLEGEQREVEGTDLYLLEKRKQRGEKRTNISGEKCHFSYRGNNQAFSVSFKYHLKRLSTCTQWESGDNSNIKTSCPSLMTRWE